MSVLLSCQSLAKSFGTTQLFEQLDFNVHDEDRIGIIGPNGVGKSTLLRILAGLESSDGGQIALRKGLRVAYIPQTPVFPSDLSVLEVLQQAAQKTGQILSEDVDLQAHRILTQVGFKDPHQSVGELSGGWLKRLAIATGTMGACDLVFFDEPTNHLDWEGILWLEQFLQNARFTWVMISHDRYILNKTASKICEINPAFPKMVFVTDGGYDAHLEKREAFFVSQAQYHESLANKVRREEEWLRSGVKARGTKAKYRIDQAHELQRELKTVQQRMRLKQTEIEFTASERKTKILVTMKDIALKLGEKQLLDHFSYAIHAQNFIGLLGRNGVGKSSFLKLISGTLQAQSGTVQKADNLRVVYFDQQRQKLDLELTLKRALAPHGDSVLFQGRSLHVVSWAKKFGFRSDQLDTQLRQLSGGEQARVLIAQLMLEPADILLLDEPTNDLDIPTLEVLEDSLMDFNGALILVTHDRYMLNRICDTFLAFDGQGNVLSYADLEQWQKSLEGATKKAKPQSIVVETPEAGKSKKKKLSYNEQREYEKMEGDILVAEEELSALQAQSEDPTIASDSTRLQEVFAKLHAAQERVDALYQRWGELEAKGS